MGINSSESLYDHSDTLGQFVDARQSTFILLAHYDTLVLIERIFSQPKRHQGDAQRIKVYRRCDFHLTVYHVVIHFRRCIDWRTGLGGTMQLFVVFQHTRDTEVAQHQFLVIRVTEEIVARFNILVNHIVLMAVGQRCGTLQGNTPELIEISIQVIFVQRTSAQILHQFIVTILSVNIGFAKINNFDYHFHAEVLNNAHHRLIDSEVRIVNLQHFLTLMIGNEEYLCLTGVIADTLDTTVCISFQDEVRSNAIIRERSRSIGPYRNIVV